MPDVLVIDDSPSALEAVETMLAGSDYRVQTCTDGQSALAIIQQRAFDLILTDIFMPEEDGLQVIRATRRRWPKLPIIAMSGITGQLSMLRVARLMGACQLLRKPFTKADLLAAMASAASGRESRYVNDAELER